MAHKTRQRLYWSKEKEREQSKISQELPYIATDARNIGRHPPSITCRPQDYMSLQEIREISLLFPGIRKPLYKYHHVSSCMPYYSFAIISASAQLLLEATVVLIICEPVSYFPNLLSEPRLSLTLLALGAACHARWTARRLL